jgi:hypothetical protein
MIPSSDFVNIPSCPLTKAKGVKGDFGGFTSLFFCKDEFCEIFFQPGLFLFCDGFFDFDRGCVAGEDEACDSDGKVVCAFRGVHDAVVACRGIWTDEHE